MKSLRKKSAIWVRVLALFLASVLQLGVIVVPYFFFQGYLRHINVAFDVISLIAVFYIVRSDQNSIHKIPWIIILLTFPVFGWVIYLVYGHARFSKKERTRMKHVNEYVNEAILNGPVANDHLKQFDEDAAAQANYLYEYASAPVYRHTRTTYYPLGEDMLSAMLEDLRSAKEFIYMEYFIIEDGVMFQSILDILKEKAAEGIDVRFVFDSFGSLFKITTKFRDSMRAAGIRCYEFGSYRNVFDSRYNNRDHRKICVVDGRVAYTGGVNLADEYINAKMVFGHWKDVAIRLEGDAVYGMTILFLALWDSMHVDDNLTKAIPLPPSDPNYENGYIAPYTDYPGDSEYVGANVYLNIINHSHKYVYIMTPYLIIDNIMVTSLCNAAKCGVDVRIMTPGIPDKKLVFILTQSYYEQLIQAGVKIYEYTPGFVHAKIFVSDDEVATVGTINLDFRSLVHHYENGVWMAHTDVVSKIKEDFLKTQERCHQVTLEESKNKNFFKRLILPILRLFAPMM